MNLYSQLIQTCDMALLGAATMFLLDVVHTMQYQVQWSRRQYWAAEFFAIVLCGVFCVCRLIILHDGIIRNYILLGFAAGIGVYKYLLRRFCNVICVFLGKTAVWFYQIIAAIVLFPWKLFYRFVCQPAVNFAKQRKQRRLASENEIATDDATVEENI